VRPQIDRGLERGGKGLARLRVDAVGCNHEVGAADVGRGRRYLRLIPELDAERAGPAAQYFQQRRARAAAEAVTADAVRRALEMNRDIVPVGEMADDRTVALAIVSLEGIERLVGKYHPEAEGIVRPVAFEHRDLGVRPGLLHQDRVVEAGRASPDDVNLHA